MFFAYYFLGVDSMLNIIFAIMVGVSVLFSFFSGNSELILEGALDSATGTVELMITILATLCVFNGMMKILEESRVLDKLSKVLKKPLSCLFKDIKDDRVFGVMSMNIAANILGLGNAATPFGLKTMELLNEKSKKATNAMCLFAVMNTSSIQIIPSTILALRIKYGSLNPYSVVLPIWICSLCGFLAGIISAKLSERRK